MACTGSTAASARWSDRLEELKLLDNTLVIVFSDNNQRGKETLYEGGARVPLLMMWPRRFKAGSVCDRIVANTDFAPTIFDACGITPPPGMKLDGRSILPVLADAKAPWRDALLLENGNTRAVVTDRWKYVALRYPPDVQAKIEEVDRTGKFPAHDAEGGALLREVQEDAHARAVERSRATRGAGTRRGTIT